MTGISRTDKELSERYELANKETSERIQCHLCCSTCMYCVHSPDWEITGFHAYCLDARKEAD